MQKHPELFDRAIIMNCPHARLVQSMLCIAHAAVNILFSVECYAVR